MKINPLFHTQSKHIELDYHFSRKCCPRTTCYSTCLFKKSDCRPLHQTTTKSDPSVFLQQTVSSPDKVYEVLTKNFRCNKSRIINQSQCSRTIDQLTKKLRCGRSSWLLDNTSCWLLFFCQNELLHIYKGIDWISSECGFIFSVFSSLMFIFFK